MEQNKLTPAEIAHVFLLYHNANTINVKHPDVTHAKNSLLKSWLGCSSYKRENFNWDKYRLKLHKLEHISDHEIFQLAKIVSGYENQDDITFNPRNVVRKHDEITYNVKGCVMVSLHFATGKIECWDHIYGMIGVPNYLMGYQYLFQYNFLLPLYFGIDHWANGKTAFELGLVI